jgi:hypothetical protein
VYPKTDLCALFARAPVGSRRVPDRRIRNRWRLRVDVVRAQGQNQQFVLTSLDLS